MTVNESTRVVVEKYYAAMGAQRAGEADLLALFAEDATYVEPWSGQPTEHSGLAAIREYFRASWEMSPPGLTITVNRVDVDGEHVQAEWTCSAPSLPAPMQGRDEITVRAGRIARLVTSLTVTPNWAG